MTKGCPWHGLYWAEGDDSPCPHCRQTEDDDDNKSTGHSHVLCATRG